MGGIYTRHSITGYIHGVKRYHSKGSPARDGTQNMGGKAPKDAENGTGMRSAYQSQPCPQIRSRRCDKNTLRAVAHAIEHGGISAEAQGPGKAEQVYPITYGEITSDTAHDSDGLPQMDNNGTRAVHSSEIGTLKTAFKKPPGITQIPDITDPPNTLLRLSSFSKHGNISAEIQGSGKTGQACLINNEKVTGNSVRPAKAAHDPDGPPQTGGKDEGAVHYSRVASDNSGAVSRQPPEIMYAPDMPCGTKAGGLSQPSSSSHTMGLVHTRDELLAIRTAMLMTEPKGDAD